MSDQERWAKRQCAARQRSKTVICPDKKEATQVRGILTFGSISGLDLYFFFFVFEKLKLVKKSDGWFSASIHSELDFLLLKMMTFLSGRDSTNKEGFDCLLSPSHLG